MNSLHGQRINPNDQMLAQQIAFFKQQPLRADNAEARQHMQQYERLLNDKYTLLAALESFVASKNMTGWREGDCDLWLGPAWEQAKAAIDHARA